MTKAMQSPVSFVVDVRRLPQKGFPLRIDADAKQRAHEIQHAGEHREAAERAPVFGMDVRGALWSLPRWWVSGAR